MLNGVLNDTVRVLMSIANDNSNTGKSAVTVCDIIHYMHGA